MGERFRHRYYPQQQIVEIWNGGVTSGTIAQSGGMETVHDETHDLNMLGRGDQGGPMILHRTATTYAYGHCFSGQGAGSQVAWRPSFFASGAEEPLNSTLYGYGGTAIARTLPTRPAVDVADIFAQSIQYKQAVPKAIGSELWREKVLSFKALGSEYLNLQFGWIPFVNDIMDVMHAVRGSREFLRKLKQGSDVKTRVGYHFPVDPDHSGTAAPAFLYSVNSGISGWDAGPVQYSYEQATDIWFKGVYTYHIPIDPVTHESINRYADYADYVLGLRPTVEAIWDAAPWSWLVDWAGNVGDVARNISAFSRDGLVLQYGYIMCHDYVREQYSSSGGANCTGASTFALSEWKVRFPASPYGFGLSYEALTASQKLVLASLGITHFRV